jgi:hypothetical protein
VDERNDRDRLEYPRPDEQAMDESIRTPGTSIGTSADQQKY